MLFTFEFEAILRLGEIDSNRIESNQIKSILASGHLHAYVYTSRKTRNNILCVPHRNLTVRATNTHTHTHQNEIFGKHMQFYILQIQRPKYIYTFEKSEEKKKLFIFRAISPITIIL